MLLFCSAKSYCSFAEWDAIQSHISKKKTTEFLQYTPKVYHQINCFRGKTSFRWHLQAQAFQQKFIYLVRLHKTFCVASTLNSLKKGHVSIITFLSPTRSWLHDINTLQGIFIPLKKIKILKNSFLQSILLNTNKASLLCLKNKTPFWLALFEFQSSHNSSSSNLWSGNKTKTKPSHLENIFEIYESAN